MTSGKRRIKLLSIILVVLTLAIALVSCTVEADRNAEMDRGAKAIRTTIMEKALQCYVIEGSYPSDLKYLEDNYGLIVNHKDYRIVYTAVAENLPPQIKVAY